LQRDVLPRLDTAAANVLVPKVRRNRQVRRKEVRPWDRLQRLGPENVPAAFAKTLGAVSPE